MCIHDEPRQAIEKVSKRHVQAETPADAPGSRARASGSTNDSDDAGRPRPQSPEPTRTRTRTQAQTPRAIDSNFPITATASFPILSRQQQQQQQHYWYQPRPFCPACPPLSSCAEQQQQHIPTAWPPLQPTGTAPTAPFPAPNPDHPLLALRAGRPPNGAPKCPDCPHCRDLEAEVKAERARASRRWPLRLGAGLWAWDHDVSSTWSGEQANACLWHRHFEKHGKRLGLGALFRLAEKGGDGGDGDVGYSQAVARVRELADGIAARRGVAYYKLLKGSVCDGDRGGVGEGWYEEEEEEEEELQPQEHADSDNSGSRVGGDGTQRSSNEDLTHKEAAQEDGPSCLAIVCHPTPQPTSRQQQRQQYQFCVQKGQPRASIFGAIGDGRPAAAAAAATEVAQRVSRAVPVAECEPDERSGFTWRQKGKWHVQLQQQKKDGDDDEKEEDEKNAAQGEEEEDDTPGKTRPGSGEFVSRVVGFLSRDSIP